MSYNIHNINQSRYYILGGGVTGNSIRNFFSQHNIDYYLWDDCNLSWQQDKKSLPPQQLNDQNINKSIDKIIISPGIFANHIIYSIAKNKKISIITDIDLLLMIAPLPYYIAVTGTNGKSTTVSLIHYLFKQKSQESSLRGNIGIPALSQLPSNNKKQYIVLELSSYQLYNMTHYPKLAVLLNITPDHLDHHQTFNNYIQAKQNIFAPPNIKQNIIISIDDSQSSNIYQKLLMDKSKNIIPISTQVKLNQGISVIGNNLYDNNKFRIDLTEITNLPGKHNQQNIIAAYATLKILGYLVKLDELLQFTPLPHRQQKIAHYKNSIIFINDSKATNFTAMIQSLETFGNEKNLFLICGGESKGDDIAQIIKYKNTINKIYLIGKSQNIFAIQMKKFNIPHVICNNLETGVKTAFTEAKNRLKQCRDESLYILLSPGCASMDQYKNFIKRGEHFCNIVQDIIIE